MRRVGVLARELKPFFLNMLTTLARVRMQGHLHVCGDEASLCDRRDHLLNSYVVEHFDGDGYSFFDGWAGSPFQPPDVESYVLPSIGRFRLQGTHKRSFLYKSVSWSPTRFLLVGGRLGLSFNLNSNHAYGGLRVDDGTDLNYVELVVRFWETVPQNAQRYYLVLRSCVSGSVSESSSPLVASTDFFLGLVTWGTFWSNYVWDGRLITPTRSAARSIGQFLGLSWAPARVGLVLSTGNYTGLSEDVQLHCDSFVIREA